MSHPGLGREDIVALLAELESRLGARGATFDLQIVGGAALLLHGLLDRATEDIDARYSNGVIDEVASEMAEQFGLPPDWLNARASAFIPDGAEWTRGIADVSRAVSLADLPTLAAMKLAAERQKDIEDLGRIAEALGIESPGALVDLAYEKYGEDSIPFAAVGPTI